MIHISEILKDLVDFSTKEVRFPKDHPRRPGEVRGFLSKGAFVEIDDGERRRLSVRERVDASFDNIDSLVRATTDLFGRLTQTPDPVGPWAYWVHYHNKAGQLVVQASDGFSRLSFSEHYPITHRGGLESTVDFLEKIISEQSAHLLSVLSVLSSSKTIEADVTAEGETRLVVESNVRAKGPSGTRVQIPRTFHANIPVLGTSEPVVMKLKYSVDKAGSVCFDIGPSVEDEARFGYRVVELAQGEIEERNDLTLPIYIGQLNAAQRFE